jgi:hypothetical protein
MGQVANASVEPGDLYLLLALLTFGRAEFACAGRANQRAFGRFRSLERSGPREVKVGSQA